MTRPNNSSDPKWKRIFKEHSLTILTVLGVLSGLSVGMILKSTKSKWSHRELAYIGFPGEIFLRMLKCLIVPLLVSSITSAIGSLDLSKSGKIARRAILYYFTTTICAVILGIILVVTIQPGRGNIALQSRNDASCDGNSSDIANFDGNSIHTGNETDTQPQSASAENNLKYEVNSYTKRATSTQKKNDKNGTKTCVPQGPEAITQDTLMDLIRNMFTDNIVKACMFQFKTELIRNESNPNVYDWQTVGIEKQGFNVLGLVVFSVVLGVTVSRMGQEGKVLQNFLVALSEAMMIITSWVIWLSPLGVGFLIAEKVLEMESLGEVIQQLGWYFLTVMIGLGLHGFVTIPLIYFIATRELPYKHLIKLAQVMATAFGTGSSSATMPISIRALDNMGINPSVTRFVIPVGATINMDGTALYEAVAALFIAQYRKKAYSFGTIVAVSITATAASIGAAGIPQAGLVTMVMVLDTVGLPAADVSLIIAVDWLLDRFRTTINVMCDAIGTILVNKLSKNELIDFDKANAEPHELVEFGSPVNGDRKE